MKQRKESEARIVKFCSNCKKVFSISTITCPICKNTNLLCFCPQCKKFISNELTSCPDCDNNKISRNNKQSRSNKKKLCIVLSVILLISCIASLGFIIPFDLLSDFIDNFQTDSSIKTQTNITSAEDDNTEEPKEEIKVDFWKQDYYIDDFGRATTDPYLCNTNVVYGKFSNSATTNSNLAVQVLVDEKDIAIFLYEYGRNLVKNYSTLRDMRYEISMLSPDNITHDVVGTMYCGADRIIINSEYKSTVFEALKQDGEIKFYIIEDDMVISTYSFSIQTDNFSSLYADTF